jgi:hypothetical protein
LNWMPQAISVSPIIWRKNYGTRSVSMKPSPFTSKLAQRSLNLSFTHDFYLPGLSLRWVPTTSRATSWAKLLVVKKWPFGFPFVAPSIANFLINEVIRASPLNLSGISRL